MSIPGLADTSWSGGINFPGIPEPLLPPFLAGGEPLVASSAMRKLFSAKQMNISARNNLEVSPGSPGETSVPLLVVYLVRLSLTPAHSPLPWYPEHLQCNQPAQGRTRAGEEAPSLPQSGLPCPGGGVLHCSVGEQMGGGLGGGGEGSWNR